MLRIFDVPPDRSPEQSQDLALLAPPAEGSWRWMDLQDATAEEMAGLKSRFGFHPLALAHCETLDQRPKLEVYEGYNFIVTQGFRSTAKDPSRVELLELHAFLGKNYLVTVHSGPLEAVEDAFRRLSGDPALAKRGPDFVYYLIVDHLVNANFPILDALSDALEEIEERILQQPEPRQLQRIFQLKRSLVTIRRVLSPQRDVFSLLVKGGGNFISEKNALYLRDVYDHLVRLYEAIDTLRDLLGNDVDAYLSVASNRTNDIMKRLTILSAIFLPLSFVTGFFGQNFSHLPFDSDALMITAICACFAIPGGMLFWFQRSKWL